MLKAAKEEFDALPRVERRHHHDDQRLSFAKAIRPNISDYAATLAVMRVNAIMIDRMFGYMGHKDSCSVFREVTMYFHECDCGFNQLKAEVEVGHK